MNFRGRIGRLEVAVGGDSGECGRCSGTIVVGGVDGELYSVSRDGQELPTKEAAEYAASRGEGGTCPVCERGPAIEIGGRRAPSQRR
jgi:hypothetical protein